jgi:hypothetical protein
MQFAFIGASKNEAVRSGLTPIRQSKGSTLRKVDLINCIQCYVLAWLIELSAIVEIK